MPGQKKNRRIRTHYKPEKGPEERNVDNKNKSYVVVKGPGRAMMVLGSYTTNESAQELKRREGETNKSLTILTFSQEREGDVNK
jgi:hypothetical protein